MEVHCIAWGLPGYSGGPGACSECEADEDGLPYSDLRPAALWRPTAPLSNERFMGRLRGTHPLRLSIYMCKYLCRLDSMHVLDHKGLTCIIIGSCLTLLLQDEARLGPTIEQRVQALNAKADEYYSANRVSSRIVVFTMDLVQKDGWGELSGPTVIVANSRICVPMVAWLCETYFDSGSVKDRAVRTLVAAVHRLIGSCTAPVCC